MNPIVKARRLRAALESIEAECHKAGTYDPPRMAEALSFIVTRASVVLDETR